MGVWTTRPVLLRAEPAPHLRGLIHVCRLAVASQVHEEELPAGKLLREALGEGQEVAPRAEDAVDEHRRGGMRSGRRLDAPLHQRTLHHLVPQRGRTRDGGPGVGGRGGGGIGGGGAHSEFTRRSPRCRRRRRCLIGESRGKRRSEEGGAFVDTPVRRHPETNLSAPRRGSAMKRRRRRRPPARGCRRRRRRRRVHRQGGAHDRPVVGRGGGREVERSTRCVARRPLLSRRRRTRTVGYCFFFVVGTK